MVPADRFAFEHCGDNYCEDCKRDGFLDDFELHEVERAAVDGRTDTIGRNHEAVFEKSYTPRECDDGDKRPVGDEFHLLELKVAVPGEGHQDVADNKQQYGY